MKTILLLIILHSGASESSIEGRWYDESGGVYLVKQKNERFAWFGQGIRGGKYHIHRGTGTIGGGSVKADWIEMPGSESYPREGSVSGSVEQDGKTIKWDKELPFKSWTRKPPAKVDSVPDNSSGDITDEDRDLLGREIDLGGDSDRPRDPAETQNPFDQAFDDAIGDEVPAPVNPFDEAFDQADLIDTSVSGADILASSAPWENARVQALMAEWIAQARPPASAQDPGWRYNEWGQMVGGRAYLSSRPPEGAQALGRHRYLWQQAAQLPSLAHGTLMQYIRHRLLGEPLPLGQTSAAAAVGQIAGSWGWGPAPVAITGGLNPQGDRQHVLKLDFEISSSQNRKPVLTRFEQKLHLQHAGGLMAEVHGTVSFDPAKKGTPAAVTSEGGVFKVVFSDQRLTHNLTLKPEGEGMRVTYNSRRRDGTLHCAYETVCVK